MRPLNKKSVFFFLFVTILLPFFGETFAFKYVEGDSYTALSSTTQETFVNGAYAYTAQIINRADVTVRNVQDQKAVHQVNYTYTDFTELASGKKTLPWSEEFQSVYVKNTLGEFDFASQGLDESPYTYPVVRNVPFFVAKDIKKGDTWKASGQEVHDFSRNFGMEKPIKIPFTATYIYLGSETKNSQTLHKITARYSYSISVKDKPQNKLADFPTQITGYTTQTIFFDNENGIVAYYTENYKMTMKLSRGSLIEFSGVTNSETMDFVRPQIIKKSEVIEEPVAPPINQQIEVIEAVEIVEVIQIPFEEPKIQEIVIEEVIIEEAVIKEKITENEVLIEVIDESAPVFFAPILFAPDSVSLSQSEQDKLDAIIPLLKDYYERIIHIIGYTSYAGTQAGRKTVSLQRAQAVAKYLTLKNAVDPQTIVVQGLGAENPLADFNDTKENYRNRRVEIFLAN